MIAGQLVAAQTPMEKIGGSRQEAQHVRYHHFALGQTVRIMNREGSASDGAARYTVKRLLPFNGTQLRYCLEHEDFLFSRLAWERDLIGVIPAGWRVDTPCNTP